MPLSLDTMDAVLSEITATIPREKLSQFFDYADFFLDGKLEHPIEPMETFLFDPYYLGTIGKSLYPKVADALIQFFEGDYIEALLTGGTRWGKSYFASFAIARMLYILSCYRFPQDLGNIGRSSSIYIVNICVTADLAEKGVFSEAKGIMDSSPYFKHDFPYDRHLASELRFQKNVRFLPGNSSKSSTIALNFFGGCLDEINSFKVTERKTIDYQQEFDQAHQLWESMYRRAKDTFTTRGHYPGRLIGLGSREYPNDWMDKRMDKLRDDPQVMILEYAQYETKPAKFFMQERFYVDVGGLGIPPRLLQRPELDSGYKPVGKLLEIPKDFLRSYELDLYGALKDISGILLKASTNAFFKDPKMVMDCFSVDAAAHPFSADETTLRDGAHLLLDRLVGADGKPLEDPRSTRFIHTDQHRTTGATGIVMGHSGGWTKVSRLVDGKLLEFLAPIVRIDMMLRVLSPQSFVDTQAIRDLITLLHRSGLNVRSSFDMVGAESMFRLREQGIDSEYMSVERDIGPYDELYHAVSERRLQAYRYKPALDELLLYLITKKKETTVKVDHIATGSKDIADGLAVICYRCIKESDQVPEQQIMRSDQKINQGVDATLAQEKRSYVSWIR
jgi:hypothetical protein